MKTYTDIIFSSSKRGSISLRCFKLRASRGWGAVTITCVVKSVRQFREPSKGFELKHSFYMQETSNWSSKLTFSRERWLGIAPVNVRHVGESNKIIRQTFWFEGRCSRRPRGVSLRPDLAFAYQASSS